MQDLRAGPGDKVPKNQRIICSCPAVEHSSEVWDNQFVYKKTIAMEMGVGLCVKRQVSNGALANGLWVAQDLTS